MPQLSPRREFGVLLARLSWALLNMAPQNRGLGCLMPLHLLAVAAAFTQPTLPRRAVLALAPALALRTALLPAGAKLVTDPKGRCLLDP